MGNGGKGCNMKGLSQIVNNSEFVIIYEFEFRGRLGQNKQNFLVFNPLS